MPGQSDLSLYETFFEMEINLSDRFTALTPIVIRRSRASEIFLLIRRLSIYNEKKNSDTNPVTGAKVIRIPAGDTWF